MVTASGSLWCNMDKPFEIDMDKLFGIEISEWASVWKYCERHRITPKQLIETLKEIENESEYRIDFSKTEPSKRFRSGYRSVHR